MSEFGDWAYEQTLKQELQLHYKYQLLLDEYNRIDNEMKWVQKSTMKIKLKNMSNNHIKNCINMLKKREEESIWIKIFENELEKRKNDE